MGDARPGKEKAGVAHAMDSYLEAAVQGAHAPREYDSYAAPHGGHKAERLPLLRQSPKGSSRYKGRAANESSIVVHWVFPA